jgi:hypothetical protein
MSSLAALSFGDPAPIVKAIFRFSGRENVISAKTARPLFALWFTTMRS